MVEAHASHCIDEEQPAPQRWEKRKVRLCAALACLCVLGKHQSWQQFLYCSCTSVRWMSGKRPWMMQSRPQWLFLTLLQGSSATKLRNVSGNQRESKSREQCTCLTVAVLDCRLSIEGLSPAGQGRFLQKPVIVFFFHLFIFYAVSKMCLFIMCGVTGH